MFETYNQTIIGWLKIAFPDTQQDDLNDLSQDIWVKVCKSDADTIRNPVAWLKKITRNHIIDTIRKQNSQKVIPRAKLETRIKWFDNQVYAITKENNLTH